MKAKEEIVISGLSGRYPECNNVEELKEALLKGLDLVTDDERRFPRGIMGIPHRAGKIPEMDKFDAIFFGVHAKQAEFSDPRHRILCETSYECIVDAGFNPQELRGSNTGVYVGMSTFTNPDGAREREDTHGYVNTGLGLSMAANRISYCFDFNARSYTLDTACSSGLYALVNAVEDIRSGKVDAALVCTANGLFHPHDSSEFNKLNMLSKDGKCKAFSTLRDGFVRSEAAVSLFLQKKGISRRVYATVVGVGSNSDGHKVEGITFPSSEMQLKLMQQVYMHQDMNPDEVAYVEAHGTGTPIGDTQELKAITTMFCNNRKDPLLVGAVKSNMGHAETASGLCSISKVLIAMETGVIPANLHVDSLDIELPGIKDGKLRVVTENLPWNGGIAALNNFGFGGANAHVVLKSNPKEKIRTSNRPRCRLVQVSGRTEEAVNYFLDEIEKNRDDEDFLALVDEVHKIDCEGHNFRGYAILGEKTQREVSRYYKRRPIWFIYTGMGAQWLGMGRDLMSNEIFRKTIERCAAALKPYNVNLLEILTSPAANTFDDSTNCFSAIAAVEIAMTDLLHSLGLVPDGIAGHSLGEVACSYADGQVSPEEAVLLAYARGYSSTCVELPPGAMAAVGLSKEQCLKLLPADIYIACQNGKHSVTISGPTTSVSSFVDDLSSQGIFAKKVNTGGLAYHSKYVKDASPHLYDFIKKVLKTPPLRSAKWVSTSVAENQKNENWARYNCAEYHTNNFCSPVLFDEVYRHIPENAIVLEVAPHGLMQAILKRELNPGVKILSMANRNSPDNEEWFLSTIGKIYLAGGQPNLKSLYKSVTYPVSRGTKMLSPLIKWDHSTSWFTPIWANKDYFGQTVRVNISNEQYAFLAGHNIDGRVLMPATGYLNLAWNTLARLHLKDMQKFPVIIENAQFIRTTVLPPNTDVQFIVNIMKKSGNFEIFEGGSLVSIGKIYTTKDISSEYSNAKSPKVDMEQYLPLTFEDVYKECHLRRYLYEGVFQGIKECDVHGLCGRIWWKDNFLSFVDTMLHMIIIYETKRELRLPTAIEKVVIDPQEHLKQVTQDADLPIFFNQRVNVIRSGGIEISGLDSSKAPRRRQIQEDPVLETYEFLPYETSSSGDPDVDTWLSVAVQIIIQNKEGLLKTLKICQLSENDSNKLIITKIKKLIDLQPMVEAEYVQYNKNDEKAIFDVIVLTESLLEEAEVGTVIKNLTESGMVLFQGDISKVTVDLNIIYKAATGKDGIYLLRPNSKMSSKYSVVHVSKSEYDWLEKIRSLIQSCSKDVVYLVSQDEAVSGLVGLMKCLLAEPSSLKFKCILIQDSNVTAFSVDNDFYRTQLEKNMTFNVLRKNQWGTFVHFPLKPAGMKEVEDATVSLITVGDLSTLKWIEKSSAYIKPHLKSEKVHVHYSSLNFRDVMVATGKLHLDQSNEPTIPEVNIGLEYSGVTDTGKRVMGIVPYEGLSLQVQTDPGCTWEIPTEWSLDEAATVPCVYATCYYAMLIRGQLRRGESVLIHAGTGGIGLSAISIALSMGCTVFTTVGSQEKREYLKKIYPQLQDDNISSSRNSSFRNMIMEKTEGRGVNVILNSLAGKLFKDSLMCVAKHGRFLEIGKVDFFNRTMIDSKIFLKNTSFHGILLDEIYDSDNVFQEELNDLLTQGIKNGVVKPLPRTIFKEQQIEDAFRFLSSGKHKGKVMIELRKEDPTRVKLPIRTINAIPKVFFDPNKSYILIGGLGGVGLELVDWLIRRGATKIILNSRRPVYNGYQSYCLKKWSMWKGIAVRISTDDTRTLEGAKNLVSFAKRLGPVAGIFNMALVLKDALIENQTSETYEAVFGPKIVSGENMDIVSRRECPELDHFVVFSSVACGRGNPGQTNYGMANSALEQLCEKRKAENFPALAVQWGAIGDVGALVKTNIINKLDGQMVAQNINSCLEALEKFMLQDSVVGSSLVLASKSDASVKESIRTPVQAVAHILGIRNLNVLDKTLTLTQLGLDSLMVNEVKQTLYRNYQIEVNTDEIRELTFDKLIAMSDVDNKNTDIARNNATSSQDVAAAPGKMIQILSEEPIIILKQKERYSRTIFMIHAIEGHVENLRSIASQLQAEVYGLQCTKEADYDSVEEYADYYIRHIKAKQPKGPYLLCAYSFGSAVAFEMGSKLERDGESAQIVMLDGSPAYVRKALEGRYARQKMSVDAAKTEILVTVVSMFLNTNQDKIIELLAATEGWKNQLQLASDLVSIETGLDAENFAVYVEMYCKRCSAGIKYEPKGVFTGKVLLIRVESGQVLSSEDYDLQKICQQEVEVVKLKGDHNTIVFGENSRIVSEKINALLL